VRVPRAVRLAAAPAAVAYAVTAIWVARGPGRYGTYEGASARMATLSALAALSLVAAGLFVSLARRPRAGDLAVLAGFVWFAPVWIGWEGGPRIVRSLGLVAAAFVFPLLAHLAVGSRSRVARAFVAFVYLEAALSTLGRGLFRDPFLDARCFGDCSDNVFLVHAYPGLARRIVDVDVRFELAAGIVLAVVCLWRLVVATVPARRGLWPALAGGALVGAATAARSVALLRIPIESPTAPSFEASFLALCAGTTLLAGGLAWVAARARLQRRAVDRIVHDLDEAPAPGSLESALGRALGDPALRIAYWLPASRRYADAQGGPVPEPGPRASFLDEDGRRIAAVTHAASLPELERELGAAVRLALENEQLQAEVLAQLEYLRASRARIVETGDAARRRLERDLHDGAQQRLLALSYELRLARGAADRADERDVAPFLAEASGEAELALDELRDLAHGIYPAILADAGLAAAVAGLAETAPLPVEVGEIPAGRHRPAAETAAYAAAAAAVEDAARRAASFVRLSVRDEAGRLVVVADDDGAVRAGPLVELADRVGALGGRLELGATALRAELPLASADPSPAAAAPEDPVEGGSEAGEAELALDERPARAEDDGGGRAPALGDEDHERAGVADGPEAGRP